LDLQKQFGAELSAYTEFVANSDPKGPKVVTGQAGNIRPFREHKTKLKPGRSFQSVAVEGLKWGDCNGKRFGEQGRRTDIGKGARFTTRDCGQEGIKQSGSGPEWFDSGITRHSSRSHSRKAASAMIAKIPEPLAAHLARVFKY
jgi:hypothetical protein